MTDNWSKSAQAWIALMGEEGDFARRHVLDAPMIERVCASGARLALDAGCGEGRFCRMMQASGVATIGIDPTAALLEHARLRDPAGDYRLGRAEALAFEDGRFDLVVSYLSMIDIPDFRAAVSEMNRVLRPGGRLLIANLASFNTAAMGLGWLEVDGERRFCFDRYLEERSAEVAWHGVRVINWHRPLCAYMATLLGHGLILKHFAEPPPAGGDPARVARYRRAPWFLIMEWEKPAVD